MQEASPLFISVPSSLPSQPQTPFAVSSRGNFPSPAQVGVQVAVLREQSAWLLAFCPHASALQAERSESLGASPGSWEAGQPCTRTSISPAKMPPLSPCRI